MQDPSHPFFVSESQMDDLLRLAEADQTKSNATNPDVITPGAPTPQIGETEFEDVIYHITHDVRASLRAIGTLPGWIREDLEAMLQGDHPTIMTHLEMLETHAARADRILVDLLAYSRVGRMSDEMRVLDLAALVREAAVAMSLPPGFRIETSLQIEWMSAPANDLLDLLKAMISNAAKHHHRTDGVIRIATHAGAEEMVLSIEDDGPGIPEVFRPRVMRLMTTLKPRDQVEGSGIGLPHSQKIARSLGGDVVIRDTSTGEGVRIEVRLPMALAVTASGEER